MKDSIFRPARKNDCIQIAKLYQISSDGVATYVWSKLAEQGEDLLKVGERRYQRENTAFSYQNCTIVECAGQLAGMLVAFPMHTNPQYQENDPILKPYSILEEDNSYYICGVALFPDYRGQGLGTRLMQIAEQQALEKGYRKLSLIVFEKNSSAKRLYEKLGYREVTRERIVPHPLINHQGFALLMVKHLTANTDKK